MRLASNNFDRSNTMKAVAPPTRWKHLSANEINERNWKRSNKVALFFNFWRELRILFSGLVLVNLFIVQSITGELKSIFNPSHPKHSEYSTPKEMVRKKQRWDLAKIICLHLASLIFFPVTIVIFFFIDHKPSETKYVGKRFHSNNERHKERWIFVNGVGVHWQFQIRAGRRIANLFQKEVRLYHNPTEGIVSDLMECLLGRNIRKFTGIASHFAKVIHEELVAYPDHKTIIISHSQGTIITSNAIEKLIKANKTTGFDRLEVYTFGCAAVDLFVTDNPNAKLKDEYKFFPYYEHFANEYDLYRSEPAKPFL